MGRTRRLAPAAPSASRRLEPRGQRVLGLDQPSSGHAPCVYLSRRQPVGKLLETPFPELVGGVDDNLALERAGLLERVVNDGPGHREDHHVSKSHRLGRGQHLSVLANAGGELLEPLLVAREAQSHLVPRLRQQSGCVTADPSGPDYTDTHFTSPRPGPAPKRT